tara:strand:+ start:98 stop:466 length:369 start_codon:yes stop_codon:yes gene_type:complete
MPVNGFWEFLTQFNVIGLSVAFIIGENINNLAKAVIDDLLMPFINPFLNRITGDDGLTYELPGGIELHLEKIVSSFIKFMCLSLVIYTLITLGLKLEIPTAQVKIMNFAELTKKQLNASKKL